MEQKYNILSDSQKADTMRRDYITPSFCEVKMDKTLQRIECSGGDSDDGGDDDFKYTAPGDRGGLDEDPFAF
ncbi:MAG: hypothetical protein K6G73_04120 [Marinilabiliaceae bacterium]|nr:hypothetical protein [Marinilabiliaceae bacterium]